MKAELKEKIKYSARYNIVYMLLLVAFILYMFLFTDLFDFVRKGQAEDSLIDWSEGWQTADGQTVHLGNISAGEFGGHVTFSKALPERLNYRNSLCFSTNNARVSVWIGGVPAYSFSSEENLTGMGYGTAHHAVSISPSDAGKLVWISLDAVFKSHNGGRIGGPFISDNDQYREMLIRRQLLPGSISVLLLFFGMAMIALHFGLAQGTLPYNLAALGISIMLIGTYCLVDTGLPLLLTGSLYASRVLDYTLLHMAAYPMVCFGNSLTRQKKRVYINIAFWASLLYIVLLLSLRYIAGIDMHVLIPLVYAGYFWPFGLVAILMADNRRYCRKNGLPLNLRYFYTGSFCLLLGGTVDILFYLLAPKTAGGHGAFLRFGLLVFAIEMLLQIFNWWTNERVSIERDRFINRVLQYAMSSEDAETSIRSVLKYLGTELRADRAYLFEDRNDGTFDNTYEWCREGVSTQIGKLRGLPYEGLLETWYDEFKLCGSVRIRDLEAYRSVNEPMYELLKPQGIHSLVTGPLELNGKYIGFFGVDNPPPESVQEISEIIVLLSYCLSQLILQRDGQNRLIHYSYYDALTGVRNRRAFSELERRGLEPDGSYGFLMCDINGLKTINDTKGHEAGDSLIVDVAACLTEVFGTKNVFRFGGDEFAVYFPGGDAALLAGCTERVRALLAAKGRSASLGAVFNDRGRLSVAEVKARADELMYEDKRKYYAGKNDRRARRGDD